MATLATLAIGLTLISEAYHKGLEAAQTETETRSHSMAQTLGNIGKGIVIGGAALVGGGLLELGNVLRESITEGKEAQDNQAQLQAVLKSTGGAAGVTAEQVNNLATHFAGLTKFSDDTTLKAENLLLTFTNIKGNVFPQTTQAVLDMSTAMHEDLQSAAIQVGKAMNDPVQGMTALRRVGVSFTDQQKEMVKQMEKSGDVAGAQQLILTELYKEFGGSAEAAGKTAEGSMAILDNKVLELKESLGQKLLPALTAAAQALIKLLDNPAVQAGLTKIIDGFGKLATGAVTLIGKLADFAASGPLLQGSGIGAALDHIEDAAERVGAALGAALTWLGRVGALIGSALAPALAQMNLGLRAAEPAFQPLLRAIQQLLAALAPLAPIIGGVLVTILGVVVAVIGGIAAAIGPFVNMIVELITAIVTVFTGVVQIVTGLFDVIVGLVTGNSTLIQAGFDSLGKGVVTIVTGLTQGVIALWNGLVATVSALVGGFITTLTAFFRTLLESVGNTIIPDLVKSILGSFTDLISQGTAKISGFIQQLLGLFRNSVAAFVQVGRDILTGVWTGINAIWGSFWNDLVYKWNQVIAITKSIFHSHSPSQVFADIGAGLMEGMAQGIAQAAPRAQQAVTAASANVIQSANRSTTFSITAQYPYRPEASLASDVRQLALVYGAG